MTNAILGSGSRACDARPEVDRRLIDLSGRGSVASRQLAVTENRDPRYCTSYARARDEDRHGDPHVLSWAEIAVEHEHEAFDARHELTERRGELEAITTELRASLITITACASAVDALYTRSATTSSRRVSPSGKNIVPASRRSLLSRAGLGSRRSCFWKKRVRDLLAAGTEAQRINNDAVERTSWQNTPCPFDAAPSQDCEAERDAGHEDERPWKCGLDTSTRLRLGLGR